MLLLKSFERTEDRWLYWLALGLRLCCCTAPGMIHPDEFFQSQEPMATSVWSLQGTFIPWEFDPQSPNRSILFPGCIAGLPYVLLQLIHTYVYSIPAPLLGQMLLYLPRLVMFGLSLLIESGIESICHALNRPSVGPVLTFSTSWITLCFLNRPFSNAMETLVFVLTLYVLFHIPTDRTFDSRKFLRTRSVLLGACLSLGCFVRFTFCIFFFPIGLYLVLDNDADFVQLRRKKCNGDLHGT